MDRYFFDIDDGHQLSDEDGMVLADRQSIETTAIRTLFEIARLEATARRRETVTVTARNGAGIPVYRATLNMQAGWLVPVTK